MNNLALIPARGGSKRIPHKNIKNFLGKPIISYTIQAALDSNLFKEVMVSTDDEEIAEIARSYGASVPFFRSKDNSDDFASTIDVIKEVVNEYRLIGQEFDNICCLYPSAPFITPILLKESFQIMLNNNYDSVLPIIKYGNPTQRSLSKDTDGKIFYNHPEFEMSRSQDLPKTYYDAGQYYWLKANICLKQNKLITKNTGCIIITELEGQDIDNLLDWEIAEIKYAYLQKTKNPNSNIR